MALTSTKQYGIRSSEVNGWLLLEAQDKVSTGIRSSTATTMRVLAKYV